MRSAFKFLAYAIDVLILVQAAAIAWAVFGLTKYVDDGNAVSTETVESEELPFTEVIGFIVHGMSGMMLIPLVALILLVVSFFAKVPEGPKYAGMLFVGILVQIAMGIFGHSVTFIGAVHGLWALLLFWLAYRTAKLADVVTPETAAPEATAVR